MNLAWIKVGTLEGAFAFDLLRRVSPAEPGRVRSDSEGACFSPRPSSRMPVVPGASARAQQAAFKVGMRPDPNGSLGRITAPEYGMATEPTKLTRISLSPQAACPCTP